MRFLPILFLSVPLLAQQNPQTQTQQNPQNQNVNLPLNLVLPASATLDPKKVILQVGDVKITAEQLDNLIDVYPANTQVYLRGPGKQQFADTLVRMLVLAAEARKQKLNENEKVKQRIQLAEDNALSGAMSEELTRNLKISDFTLRAYYQEHRCEYETWHVRHIVVRTPGAPSPLKPGQKVLSDEEALAKAQDIRKRAAEGADFAELARNESDDSATGPKGGDLGALRRGQVFPSIEEAVCSMKAGEISEPLKTPFGYQVVKLDSKEVRSFDELKPELEQRLRPDLLKKAIDELIAGTKVTKDPDYYTPDKPAEIIAPAPKKP